ncbi:MAG: hypothetical protein ACXV3D_04190 [Halobacteriota archaeon]
MATLEKRVEKLESLKKARAQKRTLPDREDYARRGQWLLDTTEAICGPCSERIPDESGAVMIDLFTCSSGKYALHCETFAAAVLARSEAEDDADEKREVMRFHNRWLNRRR